MLHDIINKTFFQNSIEEYLIALSIFAFTLIVVRLFEGTILNRLKMWADNSTGTIDAKLLHNLERTLLPAFYFVSFYLSIHGLTLNVALSRAIDITGIIITTVSGIRFLVIIADYSLKCFLKAKNSRAKERNRKAIMPILKGTIWVIGLTFLLDNLGFQISAVVAGLGIGGIAVALAAQTMLGDLFSYVSIIFDRPFEVGDLIIIGDHTGTIEHVGIKTTRIRSLGGEQLIFSNSDLTNSRIQNYKRMASRRVLFKFKVMYDTTSQQLKEIPGIITQIIENIDDATLDRAHFAGFGDFSLDFEVVYYVTGNDTIKYMNIQQKINLELKEALEQRNIEFAYLTKTLYLSKT